MGPKIHHPVRMCVVCRERFEQSSLIRLQCREGTLRPHEGFGRSFYLCLGCIDHKKTSAYLARHCKTGAKEVLMNRLKEIVVNDGKSKSS